MTPLSIKKNPASQNIIGRQSAASEVYSAPSCIKYYKYELNKQRTCIQPLLDASKNVFWIYIWTNLLCKSSFLTRLAHSHVFGNLQCTQWFYPPYLQTVWNKNYSEDKWHNNGESKGLAWHFKEHLVGTPEQLIDYDRLLLLLLDGKSHSR